MMINSAEQSALTDMHITDAEECSTTTTTKTVTKTITKTVLERNEKNKPIKTRTVTTTETVIVKPSLRGTKQPETITTTVTTTTTKTVVINIDKQSSTDSCQSQQSFNHSSDIPAQNTQHSNSPFPSQTLVGIDRLSHSFPISETPNQNNFPNLSADWQISETPELSHCQIEPLSHFPKESLLFKNVRHPKPKKIRLLRHHLTTQ